MKAELAAVLVPLAILTFGPVLHPGVPDAAQIARIVAAGLTCFPPGFPAVVSGEYTIETVGDAFNETRVYRLDAEARTLATRDPNGRWTVYSFPGGDSFRYDEVMDTCEFSGHDAPFAWFVEYLGAARPSIDENLGCVVARRQGSVDYLRAHNVSAAAGRIELPGMCAAFDR